MRRGPCRPWSCCPNGRCPATRPLLSSCAASCTRRWSPPILETVAAFLENGGSVETTARLLFIHPNTVRYRLRRVTDVTGYSPTEARDSYTLRVALTLGRLADESPG